MIPRSDWESLRALFEAALERAPGERAAFLRGQTDDEAIRSEVESLIAAHEQAGGFLAESTFGPMREPESLIDAPRLAAGSRLAAFEILEPLGTGGMGEVYRARDTRLDRFVAIKVLSPAIDIGSRGRERFEREARAISKLSHPHICALHDVGAAQVDGREVPFLVLELLEGETLAARLARGPLPVGQAVDHAIDMVDALAAAHARGMVHRDLKPANVMVTASGVKLLDFGLAQLRGPGANDGLPATPIDNSLTSSGMVIGTPPYMSPEQVEGRKVDARSDIFSFGSVLYEMLTGQRAFAGNSTRSAAAQILGDDPAPVNELARSVPADLANVVAHCLRKNPARRYQYIADVKVALEDVREASRSRPQAHAGHAGSRWRWAWTMLLVPAALVAGYFAWPRQRPPEAPPRVVPLTTLHGSEGSPTLAPGGDQVAFTWSGPNQDNEDIYVQRIGSGTEVRRTVHPARDFSPAWSPDGRWIAFLRGEVPGRSELILVPPLGGPERRVGELHIRLSYLVPSYLSWFPDSRALVVVHSPAPDQAEGLFVISIESGEKHALTTPPAGNPDHNPAVSPDGRTVVFKRSGTLSVVAVGQDFRAATPPRALAEGYRSLQPAWTPDGKEIVYSQDRGLWRLDPSGERPAARIPFAGQDALMPVLSGSIPGKPTRLLYVRRTVDHNLWRLDLPAFAAATSSAPVLYPSSTMRDSNPQVSPDGKRVAFQSDRSGDEQIWVADADGANAVQLTAMRASNTGTPRWSPDGRTIAFDSNIEGNFDVYVVPAEGGKPRRVTLDRGNDHVPSFSRDGKSLYFSSNRSGAFEIWKMPLSGGDAVQVTRNAGFVAFESFDGRHLYYTQTWTGSSSMWRIATAGGDPEKVFDGVSWRAFVVLEKGIYYVERQGTTNTGAYLMGGLGLAGPDARARLRFFDFASAQSRILAHLGERVVIGLGVSPDGRTILFTRADNPSSDLMMVENFR